MIAGEPQPNLDFYSGLLGMRLVKVSVNQDDPETFHFFYGNATGAPGSDLTFFPYRNARQGKLGPGMVSRIDLLMPKDSLDFWRNRFAEFAVHWDETVDRFGVPGIDFRDPDGLNLRMIEGAEGPGGSWDGMPVPAEFCFLRTIGVEIAAFPQIMDGKSSKSGSFIEAHLGFEMQEDDHEIARYNAADGSYVDIVRSDALERGIGGAGTVHHVAFRAENDAEQAEAHVKLVAANANVSPIIDRLWFQSIYFREPGGVLFEIATDGPGFTKDEAFENLGTRVSLPPWLEPQRERIEASLPRIQLPTGVKR